MGNEKIKVVCGANVQEAEIVGKTISEVRAELAEVLNIPVDSRAMVSGDNVEATYALQVGDTLEFIKESGDKGLGF